MRIRRDSLLASTAQDNGSSEFFGGILENVSDFVTNVTNVTNGDGHSTFQHGNATAAKVYTKSSSLLQTAARGFSHEIQINSDIKMPAVVFVLLCLFLMFLGAVVAILCCMKPETKDDDGGAIVATGSLSNHQVRKKTTIAHKSVGGATNKKAPAAGTGGRPLGPGQLDLSRSEPLPGGPEEHETGDPVAAAASSPMMTTAPAADGPTMAAPAAVRASRPQKSQVSFPSEIGKLEESLDAASLAAEAADDPGLGPVPPTFAVEHAPTGRGYMQQATSSGAEAVSPSRSSRRTAPPPPMTAQEKPQMQMFKSAGGHLRERQEVLNGTSPELYEKLMKRHQTAAGNAGDSESKHEPAVKASPRVAGQSSFQERLETARAQEPGAVSPASEGASTRATGPTGSAGSREDDAPHLGDDDVGSRGVETLGAPQTRHAPNKGRGRGNAGLAAVYGSAVAQFKRESRASP